MINYLKELLKDLEMIDKEGLRYIKNDKQKAFALENAIEILEKLKNEGGKL